VKASPPLAGRLKPVAARLRVWAIEQALPLWATAGYDRAHGRFEERLTLDGAPVAGVPQRLIVQARQIYSYGLATRRGWHLGRALVEEAYASMVRDFHRPDGRDGWVFSIAHDGTVLDGTRDLYSHAFVLLGVASYVKIGGGKAALAVADETLAFIDSHLAAPGGGYFDALPRPDAMRRQNPHMHMLEGLLSLWSSSGERRYLERAERIFELFAAHFFQSDQGVLGEYYDDRLMRVAGVTGDIVEPGHHYEWVWLLRWFERESDRAVTPYADALYRHADAHGYDGDGLIMDELLRDGRPYRRSRRIWPVTEAIKGNLAEAAAGRSATMEKVVALADRLHDRFLAKAAPGGWMDRLDERGQLATDVMPASTFYHLLCMLDELDCFVSDEPA
jgi:mannose/cellobiose epimerase-like protein (N-acyl-D-glucosamine 2-epimerase family)